MGQSKYTMRTRAIRRIAAATDVGGATRRYALNRDFLVEEHKLNVTVTQGFATTTPTSVDPRDFISTISIETNDGRRIFLTGAQAYDLARFTESAAPVSSVLGAASSCSFQMDLHYSNDESLLDQLTAIRSNELTTFDLVVTFNIDTANGFKGGVIGAGAAAAYATTVESIEYDMINETQFGQKLGSYKHFSEKQEVAGTTTGGQADFLLATGNATRMIMMHTYDTTGAVPVLKNGIVNNLRLNINGRDYRVTTFQAVQNDNATVRNFTTAGVACIDFGDDEAGFLSLENVQQARLNWDVPVGAPAAYAVKIAHDYTKKS